MPLQKRTVLSWGVMRARAALRRRGVLRGVRVVCQASGWVRLEQFEALAPGPGEILVRAVCSAISPGTERAQFNRLPNTQVSYPYTPGYSAVGVVAGVGSGVAGFRVGERVAGQLPHASFSCVPADRCVAVPETVGDLEASFVTLGVVALQGVRKAGIGFADRVAVLGRGALGILAARLARIAGAGEVVLLGRPAGGAARPDNDRHDVVLDVTGNPDAVAEAARLAAPGGRIVLIGSSRGTSPALPIDAADATRIEIRGAHAQMRPVNESLPGRWTFADEAALYMDLVGSGRLEPFAPPVEAIDPRECWSFNRRLGRGEPPVGPCVYDWRVIPDGEKYGRATVLPPQDAFTSDIQEHRMAARIPRLAGGGRRPTRPEGSADMMGADKGSGRLAVAFVGCGEIALRNAQAIADSGVTDLRWAIDPNLDLATDLTRRWGGQPSADLSRALDDREVGAVFVCAPHHLHEPLCLQAIKAGKHVLVEKPTARNAPEASRIIEAARAAGVVVSTCYPRRFLPETLAARDLVREGALGPIQGARIAEHLYRETSYWFGGSSGRSRSNWRAHRETSGGGVLLMNVCHLLDVLAFVTGLKVHRVYCESRRNAAPGDVEDMVALTMHMEGGAITSVSASTCIPGTGEQAFQILGGEGQVALDEPPRFLALRRNSLGPTNDWARLPRGTEREARRDFVRAFAAAAQRGEANPVPVEEALALQRIIDCAYQSAERGEPVVVTSLPDARANVATSV